MIATEIRSGTPTRRMSSAFAEARAESRGRTDEARRAFEERLSKMLTACEEAIRNLQLEIGALKASMVTAKKERESQFTDLGATLNFMREETAGLKAQVAGLDKIVREAIPRLEAEIKDVRNLAQDARNIATSHIHPYPLEGGAITDYGLRWGPWRKTIGPEW